MKNKSYIIIGAILIILIPAGMWWFSEERAIKRRSQHLMDVGTIRSDAGTIMRQAKSFSINGLLGSRIELESLSIPEVNGIFRRDQIEAAYSWICNHAKESEFEIIEFIDVKIDGDKAIVQTKVEGFIELRGKRPTDGISEVTLYWEKLDGSWLLTKMIWNQL